MPSECAAVGCSEKLTKEFSFHAFPFKNEARKRQWQMTMNRWDLATKKVGTKTPRCDLLKAFRKKKASQITHCWAISLGSMHVCRGVHRVTDSEKFPVRISKDEAPTQLPTVGPLFIPPLLFHLSRTVLGACLFRCVYSSFHNRLDLIREPAFYSVFYFIFPIFPCLFHHM